MEEIPAPDRTHGGTATIPAPAKEKKFTSGSMWVALAISFAVMVVSLTLYAILLVAFSDPDSRSPFSSPADFFDSSMPVMIAVCLCVLLCLFFQIVGKTDWRKELGVDVFPDRQAWLRALPVAALFVVVFAALAFSFVDMQINFFNNFDENAMFGHLERLGPGQPEMSSAPELKGALPFPDMKEFRERMLYILKFPYENGFLSGRFISYLLVCLLYAVINEVIFRGIGFAGYRRTGSDRRAAIITGVVNGLLFFPYGIVLALLLGWVRVRGGSLYCSIAASVIGVCAALFTLYIAFVRHLP